MDDIRDASTQAKATASSPPGFPTTPPPPRECQVVITYDSSHPQIPMTVLPGGACEAQVEIAIAVVLTLLLQPNAAVPMPK